MNSWTAESGSTYALCLLDTNAVSTIVKRPSLEGRGFVTLFAPTSWAPCFSIYTIFELARSATVFASFVEFFARYPCFLLKPFSDLIASERTEEAHNARPLFNAFTSLGPNPSYDLRAWTTTMFSDPGIQEIRDRWRQEELEIWQAWQQNRSTFNSQRTAVNALDASRFVTGAAKEMLRAEGFDPAALTKEVLRRFPSLLAMLYSQYYRVYDDDRKSEPSDVTDVRIAAAAPYMRGVVTERFQAEVFKKIRNNVPGLAALEVSTIRELRRAAKRTPHSA